MRSGVCTIVGNDRIRRSCRPLLLLWLAAALLVSCGGTGPGLTASGKWQTSTPEQQGMLSERLAQLFAAVVQQDLDVHSMLIIRHGAIVAEGYAHPYQQDTVHELFSVTKSFVSALVGIAIENDNVADIDQRVLDLFPDRTFENSDERKQSMTVEHLLTMTTGLDWTEGPAIYGQISRSPDWVEFVLDRPMVSEPGREFNYCSGCTHVLSAILQATAGETTLDFAQTHLFEPLGISDVIWQVDAQGIANGGWGMQMRPRDMAKLGHLFLNGGEWEGDRVIPAGWVEDSTAARVGTGTGLGYGYLWWSYPPLEAYVARGLGGQQILVMPEWDVVVVFTAQLDDDQGLFDLVQAFVEPAVVSNTPLPDNPEGQAELKAQIAAFERP
jgi:CubicO group peptidase (beta-lactamase class C family)